MSLARGIKRFLVGLGPESALVQCALSAHARRKGYRVFFGSNATAIRKGSSEVRLSKSEFAQVPTILDHFGTYFSTFEASEEDGRRTLDFSGIRKHRYIRSQVEFFFPSIPEEDQIHVYTRCYTPRPGDVVWDVGAHAGATSYFLAKLVGPEGRVYAFEPDDVNFECLKRNLELHELSNVVPVKKALSRTTGTANFNMDGTMCAGLDEFALYPSHEQSRIVSTITVEDACCELGSTPQFIKMDIEGAEVAAISGSMSFLRGKEIHLAIESFHEVAGEMTYKALERMFSQIGYTWRSSDEFGQMFTWASPHYLQSE